MCRLALMNKGGADVVEHIYGLRRFLDYLTAQCGGHGNGYALVKDGKCIDLKKGVKLSNKAIAKAVLKTDFDWLIYHTRLASCGTISDRNCHPFQDPATGDLLAANGTEHDLTALNHAHGLDRTDTETLLLDFLRDEHFVADLKCNRSALIGTHHGKAFAVRNSGQLNRLSLQHGCVCIASSFPHDFALITHPCISYFEPGFPVCNSISC